MIGRLGVFLCVGLVLRASLVQAACPPPLVRLPVQVVQQTSLPGGATVFGIAAPEPAVDATPIAAPPSRFGLPEILIADRACRMVFDYGFSKPGPVEKVDLELTTASMPGLPAPLVTAIAIAPGGSDGTVSLQLIADGHAGYRPLLPVPVDFQFEGGFFIGPLGSRLGIGLAVWDYLAGSEPHVAPHRYRLQRWRWVGGRLQPQLPVTTRGKYADGRLALAELGAHYPNMAANFHRLDRFR